MLVFTVFLTSFHFLDDLCDRYREQLNRWKNIKPRNWATAYVDQQHTGI